MILASFIVLRHTVEPFQIYLSTTDFISPYASILPIANNPTAL